jgi:uncharacterized protein YjcR
MANQYTGSFEHVVQSKFRCTAADLLQQAEHDRLSYSEVGQLLGLKQVTVRKWATRLGIKLAHRVPPQESSKKKELFHSKEINEVNFLSRAWA